MPEAVNDCDVLIVGGGPAGAAAAIRLAEAGRRVTLLEKTPASHHKVCGEFISIEAQRYLRQLGVNLEAAGAVPITHCLLIAGRQEAKIALPFRGLSLSRRRLDEMLLERAAAAGADVRRGNAVMALAHTDAGWHAQQSCGPVILAPVAFLATGKHDLPGRSRGGKINDLIGFKMHYRFKTDPGLAGTTALLLFRGGYIGIEPIEDGLVNLCLVVRKAVYARHGKDWQTLLAVLSQAMPRLALWLEDAQPCWERPLAIYGIPYGYVADSLHTDGLYKVGDQAAVIPSLFGDGMAIALHTACLACQHHLLGRPLHAAPLRQQIGFATVLSRWAGIPWLQPVLVRLCRLCPWLPRYAINLTRCRGVRPHKDS